LKDLHEKVKNSEFRQVDAGVSENLRTRYKHINFVQQPKPKKRKTDIWSCCNNSSACILGEVVFSMATILFLYRRRVCFFKRLFKKYSGFYRANFSLTTKLNGVPGESVTAICYAEI
jgi:hypothetical protein